MTGLWTLLKDTLIDSGAWLSILQGLEMTVRITVFSALLGTVLAVPLCALRLSRAPALSRTAQGIMAVLRGTPVLMLLMVFYYVVFQSSRIDASIVAIVAFSLHMAAITAEVMRSGLAGIPQGQRDAAHALSMTPWQVFRHVLLPQASRIALPMYQSALVNLLQWTSVVGYVSIVDLTRAINFLSSRTMQPMLMLFVGILLYLGMAYCLSGLFGLLGRRGYGYSRAYYRRAARPGKEGMSL